MDTFTQEDRIRLEDQATILEALVLERTRDLATTVKELESFTYSVAHDLRAPLRAIHGFSRALLEDYPDRFEGESLDFLLRIARAGERMSQLIDDLLKLSHIGRGEVERRLVDLSSIVTNTADRLAENEPGRNIHLSIQPNVVAHGDARLLLIAFENLLGNAWKFTRGRDIAVIRFYTRQQEGREVICISDNGTGFDMRFRDKLFAPFQRLHRTEEFEGTGIGLATVARIVSRHGGDVWIEGTVDVGTTVFLTLSAAC